jgi:hypothetical protein
MKEIGSERPARALPPAATARLFAAALAEMMRWWLGRSPRPSPGEMDAHFHEVVWGGITRLARRSPP